MDRSDFAFGLSLLAAVCVMVFVIRCVATKGMAEARESGRKAYQVDLPPDANPYVRDVDMAKAWLDGYVEAKKGM